MNDDTWEARIERARRLRDAVAAVGGLPKLGDDERATVFGAAAQALDRPWRTQKVFRPIKTGPVGPTPDESEALCRQVADRYREEDP